MSEDIVIPKAQSDSQRYLEKGIHLVQFTKVEHFTDKDGNKVLSKSGFPALKFHMKDSTGATFSDIIYYGGDKVQWVLDNLMRDIGVDNTQGDVSPSLAVGKKVYIAIAEKIYVKQGGEIVMRDNGKEKIFLNRLKYFPYIEGGIIPSLQEDKFTVYVDENGMPLEKDPPMPKIAPEPVAEVSAEEPKKEETLAEVLGEEKLDDVLPDKKEDSAQTEEDPW